jgi:hypothetical protein
MKKLQLQSEEPRESRKALQMQAEERRPLVEKNEQAVKVSHAAMLTNTTAPCAVRRDRLTPA